MRRNLVVSIALVIAGCSSSTTSTAPDSTAPTDSGAASDSGQVTADASRTTTDAGVDAVGSDSVLPFDVLSEVPKPTSDAADTATTDTVAASDAHDAVADTVVVADAHDAVADTVVVADAHDAVADTVVVADVTSDAAGAPFKGVAGGNCTDFPTLKVSWWYNWEQSPNGCAFKPFVPMIWGHANEQSSGAITSALASFVSSGYTEVLGFNEPDSTTQSNIPVATAFSLWPAFNHPGLVVGSPASSSNGTTGLPWITGFMGDVNADTSGATRTDFIAMHWYGWNAGSCDANASSLESFVKSIEAIPGNRPIWITEFGCMNASNPDAATVQAFFEGALKMFAKHPRIARYAWYQWNTNNELFNDSGLTPLGVVYANAPSTH
jgi:hypothetical protein